MANLIRYKVTGSPTITSEGIFSTTSRYNFVYPDINNFTPYNQSWEFTIRCRCSSSSGRKLLVGPSSGYCDLGFAIEFNNAGKIWAGLSSDGANWNIGGITSTSTYSTNTWYYVRVGWNGTEYYMKTSTNGTSWTDEGTLSSTTPIYVNTSKTFEIGGTDQNSDYWRGSIDLNNTYYSVNNVEIWRAIKHESAEGSVTLGTGYFTDGTNTFVKTAVDTKAWSNIKGSSTNNVRQIEVYNENNATDWTLAPVGQRQKTASFLLQSPKIYSTPTNSKILGTTALVNPEWKIEEVSTETQNFTIVGEPTITNKVVSNFGENSYLLSRTSKKLTNFTFITKFNAAYYGYQTYIQMGNWHMVRINNSNYTVWNPSQTSLSGVQITNGWGWAKVIVSPTNVNITWIADPNNSYSIDNLPTSGWTSIYKDSYSISAIDTTQICMGIDYGYHPNYARGSIDLANTRIYVDDEVVWEPYVTGSYVPNFTVVGSPIIGNKVIGNLDASNYIKPNKSFTSSITSFEICFKLVGAERLSTEQTFFGTYLVGSSRFHNIQCNIASDNKINIAVSANGESWVISGDTLKTTNIIPSTDFLVKFSWSGTIYKIRISTDNGSTWTEEASYSSTVAPYSFEYISVGIGGSSQASAVYTGSIDLSQCYIKINGETWWDPYIDSAGSVTNNFTGFIADANDEHVYNYTTKETVTSLNQLFGSQQKAVLNKLYMTNSSGSDASSFVACAATSTPTGFASYEDTGHTITLNADLTKIISHT